VFNNSNTHIAHLTLQNAQHKKWGGVFCILWVLMFLLYLPAASAGFVTDFTGWLDQIKNHGFWEYINRSNFKATSLYQVTQFITWIFYQLFGIHAWLWHLLFITLHVINATLLFTLCWGLLDDVGVNNSREISFTGVVLFCISPYLSEVVVWEPSFHFLQGLLMILLILVWVRKYLQTGSIKYAWWAGVVYLLSTHTLEVFYITPWLVLMLALFYRIGAGAEKKLFVKVLLLFFVPELIMFCLRLVEFKVLYGGWVSRIGADAAMAGPLTGMGKPAKYLFHLLFLGRFFGHEAKEKVYAFCDSAKGIVAFYSIVVIICGFIAYRFKGMGGKGKVAGLLFVWMLITFVLLLPLWFGDLLLVIFDRYTYFTGAFFYMLLAVLAGFITMQYVRWGVLGTYTLANLRFAILVSRYWGKSCKVDHGLLYHLPDPSDKIIVLLNLPESLHGVPMIGSEKESEYKLMHNLLLPENAISNKVYDGLSYNMETPEDGAHTLVLNDSMVRVTLNQWGTWWWYEGQGGRSYENEDYRLNMIDGGHFYELTMKQPASRYLLLYQVGNAWHTVDMNKRGADQN
jgi:hypothetical protein